MLKKVLQGKENEMILLKIWIYVEEWKTLEVVNTCFNTKYIFLFLFI